VLLAEVIAVHSACLEVTGRSALHSGAQTMAKSVAKIDFSHIMWTYHSSKYPTHVISLV